MKIEKTSRGFEIIKFKDGYNNDCSLQESSFSIISGSSAI